MLSHKTLWFCLLFLLFDISHWSKPVLQQFMPQGHCLFLHFEISVKVLLYMMWLQRSREFQVHVLYVFLMWDYSGQLTSPPQGFITKTRVPTVIRHSILCKTSLQIIVYCTKVIRDLKIPRFRCTGMGTTPCFSIFFHIFPCFSTFDNY